ncbi:MAG: saccharopine dehydrogenase family protein [Planctomycetota bacterium]|jgi:lysine 6-dehydrogenase
MRCIVLGAGRQGLAIAYDLARHGGADEITLVDASAKVVRAGAKRLRALVPGLKVKQHAKALRGNDATTLMRGHDVAVSGMPYRFNPALSKAAVRAKVSFCDLGGNTDLVKEQLKLKDAAKKAGVTIVPDCGLAPGLGNVLAAIAIGEVPGVQHVHIRCGGLPLEPQGPLGYSLLFSIEGLTNEYRGEAVVVRDGRIQRFEAFTEPENINGPPGLGLLQCFFTSGGTSTAPWRYKGKLKTYEYKTVRYHGHFDKVRAMIDLGLLDLEPVAVGKKKVVPREVWHAVAGPHLDDPEAKDCAFLRVDATDTRGRGIRYEMLQKFDDATGFTAMEQTTGYPTAVVATALARKELKPGAYTPDRAGFGAEHVEDLRKRGLRIRRSEVRRV